MGRALCIVCMLCVCLSSVASGKFTVQSHWPMTCSIALVQQRPTQSDLARPNQGVGSSYLYVGGSFERTFGVKARLTMPRIASARGLWYANSVGLDDVHGNASVWIGLMRWHHYGYRNEIALAWQAATGSKTERYFDTRLFVSNAPHELGIAGRSGTLVLTADGRTLCTAPERLFFTRTDRLYYQIQTEVSGYGDHPAGTVDRIMREVDGQSSYSPYRVHCIESGEGVMWQPVGAHTFRATGVYDASIRGHRFTPVRRGDTCRFVRY